MLYISLILALLVPHASWRADATKLPPMFSSYISIRKINSETLEIKKNEIAKLKTIKDAKAKKHLI